MNQNNSYQIPKDKGHNIVLNTASRIKAVIEACNSLFATVMEAGA